MDDARRPFSSCCEAHYLLIALVGLLSVWAAQHGLFKRAKFQMDRARDLDPEIEAKIKDKPEIMAGIAQRLVDSAKAAYKKGDLNLAHELASLLATRFAETEQGELAASVLDKNERRVVLFMLYPFDVVV